jgi:hypothetical protein
LLRLPTQIGASQSGINISILATNKITMEINKIDSFMGLHEMLRLLWDEHYIFRGENSDRYKLLPKYGRIDKAIIHMDGWEKTGYSIFENTAIPYLEHYPRTKLESMAIGQHHGLCTRLLDWTKNPLVATYFALKNNPTSDGVIYSLKMKNIEEVEKDGDPFTLKEVHIYKPSHINKRIIAQSGLFTIHPNPKEVFTHKDLTKHIIKKEAMGEIYAGLMTYNINQGTLFPDLDGIAAALNAQRLGVF